MPSLRQSSLSHSPNSKTQLAIWRHARLPPVLIQGRCIGRLDLPVDRRKSKRLAHRMRRWARQHRWPYHVVTSPLKRSRQVGEILSQWGWQHSIDPRLIEMDFGAWEGQSWQEIGAAAVQLWCEDFALHRPGGGNAENVGELIQRSKSFCEDWRSVCVVTHAGWIHALIWLSTHSAQAIPLSDQWPASWPYGALLLWPPTSSN
jgi:alpha-ribazole phosphatase